jgi:hypothetical protein
MSYPPPVYDFSKAVQRAAIDCTRHAETLMYQPLEPMTRMALRNVIFIEYMMLFMTIGLREARKLSIPETTITQLVIECLEPTVAKVTDPYSETTGDEREALIKKNRDTVLHRAQAMDEIWKSSESMDDDGRFLALFGAVSKAVLGVLKRSDDWENMAIRSRLVEVALDAWKSTLYVQVLRPLVPQPQ